MGAYGSSLTSAFAASSAKTTATVHRNTKHVCKKVHIPFTATPSLKTIPCCVNEARLYKNPPGLDKRKSLAGADRGSHERVGLGRGEAQEPVMPLGQLENREGLSVHPLGSREDLAQGPASHSHDVPCEDHPLGLAPEERRFGIHHQNSDVVAGPSSHLGHPAGA